MFQGGMDPFHGTLTISIKFGMDSFHGTLTESIKFGMDSLQWYFYSLLIKIWNGLIKIVLLLITNQNLKWAHSMIHKPLTI
jgi:hypothetical protein